MSRSDSIRAAIAFEFAAWGDEEDEAAILCDAFIADFWAYREENNVRIVLR